MSHKETSELPHWHEYNIGLAGSVARRAMGTLGPFLIGLLAYVVVATTIGIFGDEGFVWDAALALGYPEAAAATLASGIDQFTRMSLLPLALMAYLSVAVISVAAFVRDRATSLTLAAAADAGAARHAVPAPEQVGAVIADGYPGLSWFLGTNAVLFGFTGILFVPISLAQGFTFGAWIGLGMCLYAGIHVLLALRIPKVARPAQKERRRRSGGAVVAWGTAGPTR